MTRVSATTSVGSTPEGVPSAVPAVVVRPDGHPLDVEVDKLVVRTQGRCVRQPGSNLPYIVTDPTGNEIVWVSRALRMLASEGLSAATLEAYAKQSSARSE